MEDRCVCCGEVIPEGRQVCPNCEQKYAGAGHKKLEISEEESVRTANANLCERIVNVLSDEAYEKRQNEKKYERLCEELSQLPEDSSILTALEELCDALESLSEECQPPHPTLRSRMGLEGKPLSPVD